MTRFFRSLPSAPRLLRAAVLLSALSLAGTAAQAQSPAPASLTLQVNGMVCAFCAQGIEKRLKAMPETGELFIDLRNKVVAVQPRPGQTLDAQRVASEVREAGYDVVASETVAQTVAQIRADVRASRAER